jgi:hypothetical protein
MTPPTCVRTLLLADPLEGVRSVGAVENDANLRPATAARDRTPRRQKTEFRTPNLKPRTPNLKTSRPPPIIVATTARPLLADPLEGVRSVGAVRGC